VTWETPGTAKALFAHWVAPAHSGGAVLCSQVRVAAIGRQGRLGVAAVRPVVSAFHHLVGSDGMEAAVRLAERR